MFNYLLLVVFASIEELFMRIILSISLMTSLLFPVGGVVIFNDGTMIEGDVVNVNQSSVSITPIGLTFPEELLMENVDTLRLYDGEILVAKNNVRLSRLILDDSQLDF